MVSTDIVKILDFIDADNPVLARESLLHSVEYRAYFWQFNATHSVLGLSRWEERVIVVVRHLVPAHVLAIIYEIENYFLHQALFHSLSGSIIHSVLSPVSEKVALFHLVRPNTLSNSNHPQELIDIIARVAK
jgi:hypothetical protein